MIDLIIFIDSDEANDTIAYRPTKGMLNVNLRNADSETLLHLVAAANGILKLIFTIFFAFNDDNPLLFYKLQVMRRLQSY